MAKRKYSILIPTRSRAKYLSHAIQSALRAGDRSSTDFEVIVADNASDDDTPRLAESIRSPQLRWLRSEQRLSMRANFQRALDASTGTHLCIIGDDDGMNLEGLAYLDRLLDLTEALVVQWPQINYSWPPTLGGTLKVRYADMTGFFAPVDTMRTVEAIRRADFFDYHVGGNIYHGCVARDLIEDATRKDRAPFFHAVVPDVYAAMQSLFFARGRMVRARFPVSLGGASPRSNGADSQRQSTTEGSGEFRKFIAEALADPVSSGLPADCRSISMITLDAFLHATRRHGLDDRIDTAAWWRRIRPEILAQDAGDIERHVGYARRLLGDDRLGADILASSPTRTYGAPVQQAEQRSASQRRVKLTSVSMAGGQAMQDLTTATEFFDSMVVGGVPVSPTRSPFIHQLRCARMLARVMAHRD